MWYRKSTVEACAAVYTNCTYIYAVPSYGAVPKKDWDEMSLSSHMLIAMLFTESMETIFLILISLLLKLYYVS